MSSTMYIDGQVGDIDTSQRAGDALEYEVSRDAPNPLPAERAHERPE